MPFLLVDPDDVDRIRAGSDILEAARQVDDPEAFSTSLEKWIGLVRYGSDFEPPVWRLYVPEGSSEPVGLLIVEMPERDNRQLNAADLVVHPAHRRQGHGTAMMAELVRLTEEAGRSIIWLGAPADDEDVRGLLAEAGFAYASHDARRRQVLADLDRAEIDRLRAKAAAASADYQLERMTAPVGDDVLAELIAVTNALNDAPMGNLSYEDEIFDLDRMRDTQQARLLRGFVERRVIARHRETGEIGGHTLLMVNPHQPTQAFQYDTAVTPAHRGHRLGLRLKIDMLDWLAETDPQIEVVETWNNVDNDFMISVNESMGYRLSRVFNMYERRLG